MKSIRALLLMTAVAVPAAPAAAFDFDHGYAMFEFAPIFIPALYGVSPTGGDASIILHLTTQYSSAWYEATTPYTDVGVGVFADIPRRPALEHTQANQNVAVFYATYRVTQALFPQFALEAGDVLLAVGLDPDDDSTDLTSPIGIGNVAAATVLERFANDGMNSIGNGNGRTQHLRPYEDTTGYRPVNTAYELENPSRWQPQMGMHRLGQYSIQQFVTPQYGIVEPIGLESVQSFRAPKPKKSQWRNGHNPDYKAQADEVIAAVAALTDATKVEGELFQDKLRGLGGSTGFMLFSRGLTLRQFIEVDFLTHAAAWDAGSAVWKEKARHDAVRPTSAIRHLYKNQMIQGWGGVGQGTVSLRGAEWETYMPVADHPEYPSGSAALCAAHAQAMRMYFGSDDLNMPVPIPAGASIIEPGVTPAADVVLFYPTWTDFAERCAQSRVNIGVHFNDAIVEGAKLGDTIGELSAEFLLAHINGTIGDDDDDCDSDSD